MNFFKGFFYFLGVMNYPPGIDNVKSVIRKRQVFGVGEKKIAGKVFKREVNSRQFKRFFRGVKAGVFGAGGDNFGAVYAYTATNFKNFPAFYSGETGDFKDIRF